jgi:hypothetical protein
MKTLKMEHKKSLVRAMRETLMGEMKSAVVTESTRVKGQNFVLNEATYNDLLNLVYNPEEGGQKLSTPVLEQLAVDSYIQWNKTQG